MKTSTPTPPRRASCRSAFLDQGALFASNGWGDAFLLSKIADVAALVDRVRWLWNLGHESVSRVVVPAADFEGIPDHFDARARPEIGFRVFVRVESAPGNKDRIDRAIESLNSPVRERAERVAGPRRLRDRCTTARRCDARVLSSAARHAPRARGLAGGLHLRLSRARALDGVVNRRRRRLGRPRSQPRAWRGVGVAALASGAERRSAPSGQTALLSADGSLVERAPASCRGEPADQNLVAFTHGRGVYKPPLLLLTGIKKATDSSANFELKYDAISKLLSVSNTFHEAVWIKIYDAKGRVVISQTLEGKKLLLLNAAA